MINGNVAFFLAFLKAPRTVASVIPSSRFLERRIVTAADVATADVVVELGGGTGGTTRALLDAMRATSRLIVIERTEEFLPLIRSIGDARIDVVHGCASTINDVLVARGLSGADAIVSGIPFSTLPQELARNIIAAIATALTPGGRFVAYQVSTAVADYARPRFGEPDVENVLLNVPPSKVFRWNAVRPRPVQV